MPYTSPTINLSNKYTHDTYLPSNQSPRILPPIIHQINRALPALLPTEILSKIFTYYNFPASSVVYVPPLRKLYPWALGHICHQWREALWKSADIWDTIHIVGPGVWDRQKHEKLIYTILDDILTHTTFTISLSIQWSSCSPLAISRLIKLSSRRFRGLTVDSSSHLSLHTLLDLQPGSLPHLAELTLLKFGSDTQHSTFLPATNHLRPDMPSLRTLIVDGNVSIASHLLYFPLSRLTHLELLGHTVSQNIVHYILQQCSFIATGKFSISEEVGRASIFRTTGVIKSPVKCIVLSPVFALDWNVFLAPLFLPLLTAFSISDWSYSLAGLGPTFPPAIASLITRSKCSLRSFSMSYDVGRPPGIGQPHPDIIILLQVIPDLEVFVSGFVAGPDVVHTVHRALTKLKRSSWRVEPEGLCVLLDLLDDHISRKSSKPFPQNVNITCCDGYEFPSIRLRYINGFMKYRKAGVDITVLNVENNDIRLVDEQEKENDISDTGSVWAAGLGDGIITERSCCCCVQ
ncbi:hypothetical protein BDZ94DRAFT_1266539 [Collybia nuda]|uniref:F-box domain-containing protein n=1 Tax=Collybia nuda TaxID=64659 RepID=A0A9P5Y0P6_9AGAR|nr:hypothetical protein BDZ94DRAFT_1266539 [Collybia nuda]